MHGVSISMSFCSVLLIVSVGCKTAAPDRIVQAEPQPPSMAPNEGIVSSIARRFQAKPNKNARPTPANAASSRKQSSTKQESPADDSLTPESTDGKTALDDTDGLIEAFDGADPAVQAAARQQLAAMRKMQQQATQPHESTSTQPTPAAEMSLPKPAQNETVAQAVAKSPTKSTAPENPIQQASAATSDQEARSAVAFASANSAESKPAASAEPKPATETSNPSEFAKPEMTTIDLGTEKPAEPEAAPIDTKEQIAALIKNFEEQETSIDTPEGLARIAKLRMLYLLADQPDQAMRKVEDLTSTEQDYLRYQMMTMWSLVDPDGSPSRTRRWEKSLENLRLASGHLAAATESLDVSNVAFCTEVESFGRLTPFKDFKLEPGQQVILYCEIDNFAAERLSDGYETHFQGSYDLFNAQGVRVAEQVLPADKQTCNNFRRDYFIAYRLYLPKQLDPGPHRIQLTIEDLKGKKYGQSTLDFEVVAKKAPAEN